MTLVELLKDLSLTHFKEIPAISITDIAYDSRQVSPGSLFVAIRGFTTDGHGFIPQAIERGAAAVLCEAERRGEKGHPSGDVPLIVVPNTRQALADISSRFFGEPTQGLKVVGVTGTNGKTTITYLVEAILRKAGGDPAVIGTINYRHGRQIYPASHTTPESYDLQKLIRQVKDDGADALVMEVSSHALDLHRVDGIHFDVGVFTNLTPEHLDYHKDLEDYFRAKRRLFEELLQRSKKKDRWAIFNQDDPFVLRLARDFQSIPKLNFSLNKEGGAELFPSTHRLSLQGIEAELKTPWGDLRLKSPLLGAFNLSNLLAAVGVAGALGVPLPTIEEALGDFGCVPGRLERVPNDKGIHVFVDYAHTPDALRNVIGSLRELLKGPNAASGRLLVVFGCGGDRDKTKRPLMGEEVAKGADWAVVTSDNPRTEDPQAIIGQILPGLKSGGGKEGKEFVVEADRSLGIQLALQEAKPGDVVLIAGKGHEDYQILGKTKIHFDDREEAKKFLGA